MICFLLFHPRSQAKFLESQYYDLSDIARYWRQHQIIVVKKPKFIIFIQLWCTRLSLHQITCCSNEKNLADISRTYEDQSVDQDASNLKRQFGPTRNRLDGGKNIPTLFSCFFKLRLGLYSRLKFLVRVFFLGFGDLGNSGGNLAPFQLIGGSRWLEKILPPSS